jgi:carboxymethylenebutenolidase
LGTSLALTEDALATMVEDAYVNDIPVMTGGVGKPALREFYSKYFITKMPPDIELILISRTIGTDQLVDEMLVKFTHPVQMDWMLPGIAPTGKRVEVAVVGIVQFRDGKLAHEHLYWDQASVLVQLGLLDPGTLPVVGVDSACKAIDPTSLPSNTLPVLATKCRSQQTLMPKFAILQPGSLLILVVEGASYCWLLYVLLPIEFLTQVT